MQLLATKKLSPVTAWGLRLLLGLCLPMMLMFPSLYMRLNSSDPNMNSALDMAAVWLESFFILMGLEVLIDNSIFADKDSIPKWRRGVFGAALVITTILTVGLLTLDYQFQQVTGTRVTELELGIALEKSQLQTEGSPMRKAIETMSMPFCIIVFSFATVLSAYYYANSIGVVPIKAIRNHIFFGTSSNAERSLFRIDSLPNYINESNTKHGKCKKIAACCGLFAAATLLFIMVGTGLAWSPITNVLWASYRFSTRPTPGIPFNQHDYSEYGPMLPRIPGFDESKRPNIVMLIHDSLARRELETERGKRRTPYFQEFRKSPDVYEFPFSRASAGVTNIAMPALLFGRILISGEEQHQRDFISLPTIGRYCKLLNYSTSIFFAYDVIGERNMRHLAALRKDFDFVYTPDNFRAPLVNEYGMDDRILYEHFENQPPPFFHKSEKPFLSVIVYNHMHWPFLVDTDYEVDKLPLYARWWRWLTTNKYEINKQRYFSSLGVFDKLLKRLMNKLETVAIVNNTIIASSSDHGESPSTKMGRIDDPNNHVMSTSMWMRIPQRLLRKNASNTEERELPQRDALIANRNKITSNLDVFATLVELLGFTTPDDDTLQYDDYMIKGKSLLKPLSANRTVIGWQGQPHWTRQNPLLMLSTTEQMLTYRFRSGDYARCSLNQTEPSLCLVPTVPHGKHKHNKDIYAYEGEIVPAPEDSKQEAAMLAPVLGNKYIQMKLKEWELKRSSNNKAHRMIVLVLFTPLLLAALVPLAYVWVKVVKKEKRERASMASLRLSPTWGSHIVHRQQDI